MRSIAIDEVDEFLFNAHATCVLPQLPHNDAEDTTSIGRI